MSKLLKTIRWGFPSINQELQLVSEMKQACGVSWEQERKNLRSGKRVGAEMRKCLLISANVHSPYRTSSAGFKNETAGTPCLVQMSSSALDCFPSQARYVSDTRLHLPTQCMSMERTTPRNYLKRNIRPSNQNPNYFMECDEIKRKGEETDVWCKT